MKMNYALALGLCLAANLMAQTNSTAPAKKPAPAKAIVEPTVSLVPGPATVNATRVMLRARSTIMGERLGRFDKGDTVVVLEQVENKWAKGPDPKQWARIQLPAGTPVWVFAQFVGGDGAVTASRVNLRGGPGENYSILGRLPKGAAVKVVQTKGEWMQIEVPEVATAYIAAMYLKQDATMIAKVDATKTVPVLEPASSTNTITDIEPVVAASTVDVANTNATAATNDLAAFLQQMATGEVEEPEDPAKPRIVMREGIVFNATSIQAPSHYSLLGLETGRNINYLYTTSTNVNLNRYNGKHVIVTGEESLDKRWPNTPVLTLQRIQVIDDE